MMENYRDIFSMEEREMRKEFCRKCEHYEHDPERPLRMRWHYCHKYNTDLLGFLYERCEDLRNFIEGY